jgi:hypothetical protein
MPVVAVVPVQPGQVVPLPFAPGFVFTIHGPFTWEALDTQLGQFFGPLNRGVFYIHPFIPGGEMIYPAAPPTRLIILAPEEEEEEEPAGRGAR